MVRKPDITPGDLDDALNPHRADDEAHARDHTVSVLTARGVHLSGDEPDEELADLWSAVERFESVVSARGADSLTNSPESSEPDNPVFVLPERRSGESAQAYTRRILESADRLTNFERR